MARQEARNALTSGFVFSELAVEHGRLDVNITDVDIGHRRVTIMDELGQPDWAGQKRRQRGHAKGDHSNCDYNRCPIRREREDWNEERLDAIALFREINAKGADALKFFGDDFDAYRERAERELTDDLDWLSAEPDIVNRLRARAEVREYLSGITRPPLDR